MPLFRRFDMDKIINKFLKTGWRTTLVGLLLLAAGLYELYHKKEITTEGSFFILTGLGFLVADDNKKPGAPLQKLKDFKISKN